MRERRQNINWAPYVELAKKASKTMRWTDFAREHDLPEASGALRMKKLGIKFVSGRTGLNRVAVHANHSPVIEYNGTGDRTKVEFEVNGVTIACAPSDIKTILEGFKNV